MARESLITPEGLEKLKSELEELQTVKRREVAERIKEARERLQAQLANSSHVEIASAYRSG